MNWNPYCSQRTFSAKTAGIKTNVQSGNTPGWQQLICKLLSTAIVFAMIGTVIGPVLVYASLTFSHLIDPAARGYGLEIIAGFPVGGVAGCFLGLAVALHKTLGVVIERNIYCKILVAASLFGSAYVSSVIIFGLITPPIMLLASRLGFDVPSLSGDHNTYAAYRDRVTAACASLTSLGFAVLSMWRTGVLHRRRR